MPRAPEIWLRKHADYQRAYAVARKGRTPLMAWFVAPRAEAGPIRVGLTVPRALGKAVERNRIKRRMRAALRKQPPELLAIPADLVLHPRRQVLACEFAVLVRETERALRDATRGLA